MTRKTVDIFKCDVCGHEWQSENALHAGIPYVVVDGICIALLESIPHVSNVRKNYYEYEAFKAADICTDCACSILDKATIVINADISRKDRK